MDYFRENCLSVKDLFCYDEWHKILSDKSQNLTFKHRGHFRLPQCDNLPLLTSDQCSAVDLFHVTPDRVTSTFSIRI